MECEAHWSLLGLWTMMLYARKHLPQTELPTRLSVARVLHAFHRAIDQYPRRPDQDQSLVHCLRVAVLDPYTRRDKRSRGYPRKKYESPAKPPKISTATPSQRLLAQQLMTRTAEKRLTA